MQTTKTFLSRTQAAKLLGRSPRTLRNLQAAGRGPIVLMIGDRAAYDAEALEQWIAAGGDA